MTISFGDYILEKAKMELINQNMNANRPITADESDYLERIKEGLDLYSNRMEKLRHRLPHDHIGLADHYLKGRAWIVCELDMISGSFYERATLSCRYANPAVGINAAIGTPPRCSDTGTKRLLLIAWDVKDETSDRIADSGDLYEDVYSQPDIIALGGGRMCVVLKIKNGRMKVDLVEFTRSRGFKRFGSAETSGPIDDHGRVCLVSPVDESTARRAMTPPITS